jgi:hypothetical protein
MKTDNELLELADKAGGFTLLNPMDDSVGFRFRALKRFRNLIIQNIVNELRDIEKTAEQEYKNGVSSERNTFNGNDLAELIEDRYCLKE